MTIRKRLTRSNLVMILIPVAIAAVLLLLGGGLAVLLLKRVYLPRLGLSAATLHETGEQLEAALQGAKAVAVIYGGRFYEFLPDAAPVPAHSDAAGHARCGCEADTGRRSRRTHRL